MPTVMRADERGELYKPLSSAFAKIQECFYSWSEHSVLRGMHWQPFQTKIVVCVVGRVIDVLYDTRRDSPTYRQHWVMDLVDSNAVYIPPGVAHGFYHRPSSVSLSTLPDHQRASAGTRAGRALGFLRLLLAMHGAHPLRARSEPAMRALVTGTTGFIGRRLCAMLEARGDLVAVAKRGDDLHQIMRSAQPDVVFHLAAAYVRDHEPLDVANLVQSNVEYGTHVLEAMRVCGVTRIVAASTLWVWDHPVRISTPQPSSPLRPSSHPALRRCARRHQADAALPGRYLRPGGPPRQDRLSDVRGCHHGRDAGVIARRSDPRPCACGRCLPGIYPCRRRPIAYEPLALLSAWRVHPTEPTGRRYPRSHWEADQHPVGSASLPPARSHDACALAIAPGLGSIPFADGMAQPSGQSDLVAPLGVIQARDGDGDA